MSDLQNIQTPKWWRKKDVRKTFVLWIICTVLVGIFGDVFHTRGMGAPASATMAGIINLMRTFTWVVAPVAGLVFAMMITALTSTRHYGDNPPAEADHQIRNSPRTNAVWIVVSALLCLFALVVGMIIIQEDSKAELDANAIQINVTGQQWAWNFDYENGARSPVLYLPVNKPVVFHVTSKDVKHSFWLVQMGVKIDANPGYITETAITPNKLGIFDIRCAELCGTLHAYMQNKVHVVSASEYQTWLETMKVAEAKS